MSGDKIGGNIFKHKYYEHNDARAHTQEVSPMISSVQFTSGNQKKWSDRIATNESADCFLIPTVDIPQNGAQISVDAIYYDEGRNEWDSACSLNLDGVEDGLYNIYVFVQSDFDGNYNAQLEYPDEVQTKIDADRITQRFENTFYTSNRGKQNVRVVALLERLYDFKLVGGITETLDYNAQTTYFASRVTDIGSNVTYEIRDVYFPGRENYHRIDLENGHFYNDYVFSIGSSPDWRDLPYTVSCPPDDPLLTTDLTVGVDYDVGTQSGKVVGMKGRGGMYDLTIDINFKTVMSSTTDRNNIESIEISAQPSENDFSILIYMNESGIAEKEGFFDSGSSTGLLGQASFSVQGGSVPSLTGSTLFGGQTFESIVNEHGGYFYDYVTGRRFTIADLSDGSFQVTKSYVFYLNPDGGSK